MNLLNKLSPLIQGQFPEFVQTDYPVFATFVKAYYEFMEQNGQAQELLQNTLLYGDIDSTTDDFIQYFMREFWHGIPESVLFNKRALTKHITSLYSTKGSSRSYDLLFRLLYDTEVEIFYPKTKVFRASDGKWIRNVSIFLQIQKGDANDLANRKVIIRNASGTTRYELNIERRKIAENIYGGTGVAEFFIDDSTNIPISVGDIIEFEEFRAVVIPTPNQYKIIAPGKGFKVGDVLIIRIGSGRRSKAKVIKVDGNGGIKALHLISFGINYGELEFYNFFTSKKRNPVKTVYDLTEDGLVFEDVIDRIEDEGWFFKQNYTESDYFASDYVGELDRMFREDTGYGNPNSNEISTSLGDGDDAIIMITPGGKAKYPGYYKSNDSFPSDDIYIQDYHYYQPFSYVLRVDQQLKDYKRAVLENIHPAGTKLFAEYLLKNEFAITTTVNITKNEREKELFDSVSNLVDVNSFEISSVQTDISTLIDTTLKQVAIQKDIFVSPIDNPSFDSTLTVEEDDLIQVAERISKEVDKVIKENIPVIDEGTFDNLPPGEYHINELVTASDEIDIHIHDNQLELELEEIFAASDLLKGVKLTDNVTKLDVTETIDADDSDLNLVIS